MRADVIVVTWRSGERVLRCLRSLSGQQPAERTFVVDNASGDATVQGVRESFPGVRVLELRRNVGFGAGVNAGARLGAGEAIVLVNDDVEVQDGFIEAVLAPLHEDPRRGMVAAMSLMPAGGIVDGYGIELDRTLAAYNRLRHRPPGERPGLLAMPSGGLAAYRRAAFEQVGGFDERLFAYGEDVDLGLRLRLAGWQAGEAPTARGVHEGGASIGVDSPLQRELAGFARGFLLRRYGLLAGPAAPRTLLFEGLVVGYGLLVHRSAVPLRARIRGWRAAGGERLPVPPGAIDGTIGAAEALRRLRRGR